MAGLLKGPPYPSPPLTSMGVGGVVWGCLGLHLGHHPLFLNKHATWSRILLYLGWQCKYQQRGGTTAAARTRSAWACLRSRGSTRPWLTLLPVASGAGWEAPEGKGLGQSASFFWP